MEADQFDELLRSFGHPSSRRTIGRLWAGFTMAGPVAALRGLSGAEAKKKKKKKKKCKGGTKKCGKICIPSASCCGDAECPAEKRCQEGTCVCRTECCSDADCLRSQGQICERGACICPASIECCADADCPAGSGKFCQDLKCRCPDGQGNSGGVCGVIPIGCFEPVVPCASPGECCSGTCAPGEGGMDRCQPSEQGESCLRDDYCAVGLVCRGFKCTAS